ncbi:hypothetical protein JT359_02110 [Candidatus Poribacteria bacterium]|nr:hypothetical protein [Candidatus Poribacteria bacterium]
MNRPVHPIFNNRTVPIFIFILFILIYTLFQNIPNFLWAWEGINQGNINVKLSHQDDIDMNYNMQINTEQGVSPKYHNALKRIRITWYAPGRISAKNFIILNSNSDTFTCIGQIPAGYRITITTISVDGTYIEEKEMMKGDGGITQLNLTRNLMSFHPPFNIK